MDWLKCGLVFKVYQTMFRVIKDSENVDERQHCFLIQTSGHESRYLSVETRQELLRIENAWHCSVCAAVMKLGVSNDNAETLGPGCTGVVRPQIHHFTSYHRSCALWLYL
jgi:hypothetical protein